MEPRRNGDEQVYHVRDETTVHLVIMVRGLTTQPYFTCCWDVNQDQDQADCSPNGPYGLSPSKDKFYNLE